MAYPRPISLSLSLQLMNTKDIFAYCLEMELELRYLASVGQITLDGTNDYP